MTNHDVAVATPSDDTNTERPDRSLAEQLVDQARADGKDLVGPGGLLSELTKQVLETGSRSRWKSISATEARRRGPQPRQLPQRHAVQDGDHRDRPGRDRRAT
jgi:hypothetical protein